MSDIKRTKILVIIGRLDLGGAEKHLLKILPSIDAATFLPSIYVFHSGGVLTESIADAGVRVIESPSKLKGILGILYTMIHLFNFLRKEKPDIIHYFLPEGYILGMFCSVASPHSKRIMSRRSLNNYQSKHLVLKRVEYFLHKYIDVALGNSLKVVKQLAEEGVSFNKIGLLYNGINIKNNLQYTKKEARNKLGIKEDALVFVVVANLIPYKGHEDLLNAFGFITDELPTDWCLICVGRDDGYGKELYEYSIRQGIHSHIIWTGQTLDVDIYNIVADIGILPSHEEGFSNSLLEGMWSGLPMVVTDVGGNSEAVLDGETGIIVPARSPQKLADRLLLLAENKEYRKKLGEEAQRRVMQEFNLELCVAGYNMLYSNIIKGEPYYNAKPIPIDN